MNGVYVNVKWMYMSTLLLCAQTCVADWLAGAASRDVTPAAAMIAAGDVYMGGYGLWTSRGAAEGVHDPITVQALCLESGQAVCIAVIDGLGVPTPVIGAIQAQVAGNSTLSADHVLIAATHTHAAPDLLGLWGGSPPEYRTMLVTKTAEALLAAWRERRAAMLVWATAAASSRNRRDWPPDDTMVVLQASNEAGRTIATFVNFAAHPVVTPMSNLLLSSDYPHGLRAFVGARTDAPVLFVNGALGDASHAAPPADTRFERARLYGEQLGAIALDALDHAKVIEPGLGITTARVRLTLDNRVLRLANWLGLSNEPLQGRAVDARLAYLTLGKSVAAVAFPGEPLTALGRSVKAELGTPARMIFGLTGGTLGYFVPESEWEIGRNDNYEETLALSQGTASELLAAARALIRSR